MDQFRDHCYEGYHAKNMKKRFHPLLLIFIQSYESVIQIYNEKKISCAGIQTPDQSITKICFIAYI